jgi:hypothetical protein
MNGIITRKDLVGVRPPRLQAVGQARDDRREDHQRDAVPMPRWVMSSPIHMSRHGAGGQGQHDEEDVRRVEVLDDRLPALAWKDLKRKT